MADRPPRTRPLTAARSDDAPSPTPAPSAPRDDLGAHDVVVRSPGVAAQSSEASRYQRLADGVRSLRAGGGTLNLSEKTLMVIGGIVAPLGIVVIIIGWYGAAHSPFLFQQVPYLISGLGIGLGLVFLGSFFYFAHWITELVKEGRSQSAAMIEAIARLEETVRQQAGADRLAAASESPVPQSPNGALARDLVVTGRGTMAHRPDCVVVAGKTGLRRVTEEDELDSCRLCEPYAEEEIATPT